MGGFPPGISGKDIPMLKTKVCPLKHETFLRVLFPKDSFTDSYTLNFDFFYLHTYSMDNLSIIFQIKNPR